MAFDPDAYLAANAPKEFDPDAYLAAKLPGFLRERGKLGADGNYSVETPGGAVHFAPDGAPIQSPEQKAALNSIGEPDFKTKVLNRVVTVANSAAMGLGPQAAGFDAAFPAGPASLPGVILNPSRAIEAYRHGRDSAAKTVAAAEDEAGIGYQLAGAVLGAGPAAAGSLAGRLAVAGGIGAINAGAASKGDLTRPGEGDNAAVFGKDVAMGLGIGVAGGVLGEVVGVGARAAAKYATKAAAQQVAKVAAAAEKALASKTGELGNAGMAMQNALDRAQYVVENPTLVGHTPEVIQQAAEFLASPAAAEARTRAAQNAMARVPAIVNKFDRLAQERVGLQALNTPAAIQQVADEMLSKPWVPLAERTQRYLGRQIPYEIAKRVGNEVAGTSGTAAGEIVGTGLSGLLGAPGTALSNAMKDPRTKYLIGKTGEAILSLPPKVILGAVGTTTRNITEKSLGELDLAAEKIVAHNGMSRLIGANEAQQPDASAATTTPAGLSLRREFIVNAAAHSMDEHDAATDGHIEKILKGERDPLPPPSLKTQDFGSKRMRKDAAEAHQQGVRDVRTMAADPSMLVDRVAANVGNLGESTPGLVGAMHRIAHNAVTHLAKVSQEPPKGGPLAKDWTHSDAERHDFAARMAIATKGPHEALRHAAAGTLTEQQHDTLKAVWPEHAKDIANKLLSRLAENPHVAQRSRLAIYMLTGVDPDGSFGAVAYNQQIIAGQKSDAQQKPPPSGKTSMTLAQRTATPSQKAELKEA